MDNEENAAAAENSDFSIMKGTTTYRKFLPSPRQFDEGSKVPIINGEIQSNSAAKVFWNPIAGATGYKVMLDKTYIQDAGNVSEYPWGSLTPGQHVLQVASIVGGSLSEFSNEFRVDFKPANQTAPSTIIIRPNEGNSLPSGNSTGSPSGATTTTGAPAQTAVSADDLLFGYDKSTVLIVGGLAVSGLALWMLSGKK